MKKLSILFYVISVWALLSSFSALYMAANNNNGKTAEYAIIAFFALALSGLTFFAGRSFRKKQ